MVRAADGRCAVSPAEQRLVGLERQVADLAAEMQHLREQAFTLMTIEELILKHRGLYPGESAARPARHLHALDGGAT